MGLLELNDSIQPSEKDFDFLNDLQAIFYDTISLMKILLTFLANAQPSISDEPSRCASYDTDVMQTMSTDNVHAQCDSACSACVAIQNTSSVLYNA